MTTHDARLYARAIAAGRAARREAEDKAHDAALVAIAPFLDPDELHAVAIEPAHIIDEIRFELARGHSERNRGLRA